MNEKAVKKFPQINSNTLPNGQLSPVYKSPRETCFKVNIIVAPIVIDKPKGMVVHPGAGNREYTLANALAFKFKNQDYIDF